MKRYSKFLNKMSKILLYAMAVVLLVPQNVLAIDRIKEGADVSLSVVYGTEESPVPGAKVDLYKVADVYGFGEFIPTEEFASYPLQWEDLDSAQWKLLAETLASYIVTEQMKPLDTGITDADGRVQFPSENEKMTTALYLIMGDAYVYKNKVYTLQPTLICLPNRHEDDVWQYEEEIYLKYEWVDEVTELQVRKIWSGDDSKKRPEKITIQLYQGSELYDTVVLNEENNWYYTWKDLKTAYDWKIVEKEVPAGYTVSVGRNGTTFVVTNTYTQTVPKEPELPQTGMLWWPVPILAGTGLLFFLAGWMMRRRDEK